MNESNVDYIFGIYVKDNDKYIGNIKVGNIGFDKTADIGMMIGDKSEHGKGYATDAISCISNFSFNILGLKKLVAGMIKLNYGSYKSFINNGFIETGRKKVLFEGNMVEAISVAKENK
jgi:RimJ/RimL family protein N-acetyltransferase